MTCEKLDSDFSATILAMIVSIRHFFGWLVSAFHSREDLISRTSLSVGNCWLCMRNNLAVD
jgi:hypothetical protein